MGSAERDAKEREAFQLTLHSREDSLRRLQVLPYSDLERVSLESREFLN